MSLSFVARKAGLWLLVVALPAPLFGQASFRANGGEYAPAPNLPGVQTHPALSVNSSGGYLVWEDNAVDGDGLGIRAVGLDPDFKPVDAPFRVNHVGSADQERPQVALLQQGGAVFVWQGGKQSFQKIYARFISSSNTWITGDVQVNGSGGRFHANAAVATLANGNVVIVWASFDRFSSSSMQDVYGQIFSPSGQKLGGEFLVNQFTSFNQRTPSVAALSGGGFVVSWVSEQQRTPPIDNPDPNFVYSSVPTVDIYARLFQPSGVPVGNEFLVNTVSDVCANPSVAAAADGRFLVAWSQRDLALRELGWDVVARLFGANGAGGETRRVNTYRHLDQFAPQVSMSGSTYLITWTSWKQDGSWEGVYGQYLNAEAAPQGSEFRVNTATVSRQLHPALASDHSGRFIAVWSASKPGANLQLAAQKYYDTNYTPPVATAYSYGAPPPESYGNGGSGGSGSGNSGSGSGGATVPRLEFPSGAGIGEPLPDGFTLAKGSYNGLFYGADGLSAGSSGYVSAKTTEQGSYSAKVSLGGKSYTLSGRFDAAGRATNSVTRPGASALKVEWQLDLAGGDQLRGRVSSGGWSAELVADRQVWSKSHPAAQAGTYTVVIPGAAAESGSPSGSGFGTLKVDGLGVVKWMGTLADGTKVSQGSVVSRQGIWPMYQSVYGGGGLVMSWMQFATQAQSDLAGQLVWLKPAGAGKYYPGGFTNEVMAVGSSYAAPAPGKRALNLSGGSGSLVLSGGGLSGTLSGNVTLGLNNKGSGSGLSLSITPTTGLFKGSMLDGQTGKAVTFQGALFKKTNIGVGYFLGPSQSGGVYLGAPE